MAVSHARQELTYGCWDRGKRPPVPMSEAAENIPLTRGEIRNDREKIGKRKNKE